MVTNVFMGDCLIFFRVYKKLGPEINKNVTHSAHIQTMDDLDYQINVIGTVRFYVLNFPVNYYRQQQFLDS